MYPFEPGLTYPRNQWYIAAHSSEVGRTLLERRILGDLMVIYRTEAGKAVIMDGLCPHRLFPLAQSKLVGDSIECGYHGFTFDCTGTCTKIPSQANVPSSFRTRSYPVVEKAPYVWVWTGEADKADEALLPDYEPLGLGDGFYVHTYDPLPLNARYQLLVENLYDLTHLNFIHGLSVDGGVFFNTDAEIRQKGRYLCTARVMRDEPISPFFALQSGESAIKTLPEPKIDIELLTEMFNPGLIVSGTKTWHGGHYNEPEHYFGAVRFLHGVTPETPTSTHYFPGYARDLCKGDQNYDAVMDELDRKVRGEDIVALNAIEARIALDKDLSHEISALSDSGAIRARRMIAAMMEAERKGSVKQAAE